jgi:tetratricopeptide (TPR) repeat protein
MKKLLIVTASYFMMFGAIAQEEGGQAATVVSNSVEVYVGGNKYSGTDVEYKAGKVQLKIGTSSASTGYEIDKITRIVSPMPAKVRSMLAAYEAGNFQVVASAVGATVVEEQKFLGWGRRVSFLHGYSLYRTGKINEAQNIFSKAQGHIRGVDEELDGQLLALGVAACELANKKLSVAKANLKKIVEKLRPEAKSIFYNLEGDILMQEGDDNQAILSYYKALLLDDSNPYEKGYAISKIQSIYSKLNDPRAQQIKELTK